MKHSGFTLIEMIVVIVLIGILSAMTTDIMTLPVVSYLDLERRTTLVDSAEMSLRHMQRDIRRALPNSIRISNGGTSIELLHTTDGSRYRATLAADGTGDILDFTSTDLSFDILGSLTSAPVGNVVVYHLGSTGADAYAGDNRASLANTSTVNKIVLTTAKHFPFQSPQQRLFIVDTPISYQCIGGELLRYDNYSIGSAAANPEVQAKAATLSCLFNYSPGSATRAGLVTLNLTLTDTSGESVRLIHQVHVDNMP